MVVFALFRPIDSVRFGRSVLPGEQEFVVLTSGRMTIVDGLSLFVALKTAKIQVNYFICLLLAMLEVVCYFEKNNFFFFFFIKIFFLKFVFLKFFPKFFVLKFFS